MADESVVEAPTEPQELKDAQRAQVLERFEAPDGPEEIVEFTTDELTARCPFDFGGPDFYRLTIRYVPDQYVVESKSLKKYVETWRDERAAAELIASVIYEDIQYIASPVRTYLRLEQARRGGIEETVEVGDRALSD